ncbi:beta-N-acetylhexosaminidase [Actinomycetota bacterium]|nr:beta-N-acetylhexosaminidase [Actinomycetota bacterium]
MSSTERVRWRRRAAVGLVVAVLGLTACTGSLPTDATTAPVSSPSSTPAPPPPPTPPPATPTADPLAGWTLEQKVAQVVMVGVKTSAPQQSSHDIVADGRVANVFLQDRTSAGRTDVRNLVEWFTQDAPADATHGEPMLVATDQEGGQVQTLRGEGFSTIPSALDQGSMSVDALRSAATVWGQELAAVGVNLDLAPVVDLPTRDGAAGNTPVGHYDRQYGYTVDDVVTHAEAFAAGLASAGVQTSVKHFPGLGRVAANTDTDSGVTDSVTGAGSDQVEVFRRAIADGASFVMVSTADYTLIDPGRSAAFSAAVIDGLLRTDLGFDGVVITDDLSAAAQVAAWAPGDRAVQAIAAGADIVLASKDPTVMPAMVDALTERARSDPEFAARLDEAVEHVLAAKSRL